LFERFVWNSLMVIENENVIFTKWWNYSMTKSQILKALKTACSHKGIRLPTLIDFNLNGGVLTIDLPWENTIKNMQKDNSAFEGWAFVLKRWISTIRKVKIKWADPSSKITLNQEQHYQRFLFRVMQLDKAYEWIEIDSTNRGSLSRSKYFKSRNLLLNTPSSLRPRKNIPKKPLPDYKESELEMLIVTDAGISNDFRKTFELVHLDNQLPVGVFDGVVSEKTKILTGSKSAIDIWGINKNNELCLFELKDAHNKKVGALTEMFFYAFLLNDVRNKIVKFDINNHPGLDQIAGAERIVCYLLAPDAHPLIDCEVLRLMNASKSGITYKYTQIESNLNFKVVC
jgi:hypothetical protein